MLEELDLKLNELESISGLDFKLFRIKNKLSATELGRRLGTHRVKIGRIENAENIFDAMSYNEALKFFDIIRELRENGKLNG